MSVERFDHIIKQKLENIDVDTSNMNWDVFKSTMEAAAFDQSVAEQLSDIDPDIPTMDWNSFKTKMDASTDTFDAKIKEKVESFNPDVPTMNWAKMKQEIDLDFDKKVVELVDSSKPTLQQEHWPLLKEKMLTQQQNREARYKLKLVEAAAVLALFFLFNLGYKHINKEDHNNGIVKIEHTEPAQPVKVETNVQNNDDLVNLDKSEINNVVTVSHSGKVPTVIEHPISQNTKQNIFARRKNAVEIDSQNTSGEVVKEEIEVVTTAVNHTSGIQDTRELISLESIVGISSLVASESQKEHNIDVGYPIANISKKKSPRYIELSYGAMGNHIITPYDNLYRVNGAQLSSTNAMLSVLFSKSVGNWEYFTGFNYGLIKYNPKKVEELVPNTITGEFNQAYALSDITLEKITLNGGLRYKKMYGYHAIYAMAGLNTHLITSTMYTINEYEDNNTINSLSIEDVPSNTILEQKNFHKGLVQGGNMSDNIHFSVGLGIGYRYNINDKLDLFSQVRYNHNVFSNGVGPNKDKINSTSTDIGIRFKL